MSGCYLVEGERWSDSADGLIDAAQMRKLVKFQRGEQMWDLVTDGVIPPVLVETSSNRVDVWFDPADADAVQVRLVRHRRGRDERAARAAEEERLSGVEAIWRKALAEVSPSDALWLLSTMPEEEQPLFGWSELGAKRRALQAEVDKARYDPDEQRPTHVPERARRYSITTGLGPVPIWCWLVKTGWRAKHGGPRPGTLCSGQTLAVVRKSAGQAARHEYGTRDRKTSTRLRFIVLARDEFTCRYCGRSAPKVELHVDHVTPLSQGGRDDDPGNLVTACADCNSGKASLVLS